jgi:hypothetical protein
MKVTSGAKITLLLRDQDVNVLLKALQKYTAENEDEARNREYLIEVLEYLAIPV